MPDDNSKKPESRLPAYLTALGAFIAAMMPLTAFVNGRYNIEIEREKFLKQLQLNYIDRALDSSRDPTYRESFLQFLIDTTEPPDSLRQWAQRERAKTDELARLRAEFHKLMLVKESTASQLSVEYASRSREKAEMSVRERELSAQLKKVNQDRLNLEVALRAAELRTGAVQEQTSERFVMQVFSHTEKAEALRVIERLKQIGQASYDAPVMINERMIHRVRVGPFESKKAAQDAATIVRRELSLDSWITEE
jgi:hypothetical protein